jgi:ankyrin repeat protein
LLDSGIDINGRDQCLRTALHCAVPNDNPAVVQVLLSRRAGISLRDDGTINEPDGFTLVENDARWNAIGAMRGLIVHGVDVENYRALFLAARGYPIDMFALHSYSTRARAT